MASLSDAYVSASAKVSEVTRKLAFAGIAVVWLFSGADANPKELDFPTQLLLAAIAFVASLAIDWLHAVVNVIVLDHWGKPTPSVKGAGGWDHGYSVPRGWRWASVGLFWLKHAAVGLGYVVTLHHLIFNIVPT